MFLVLCLGGSQLQFDFVDRCQRLFNLLLHGIARRFFKHRQAGFVTGREVKRINEFGERGMLSPRCGWQKFQVLQKNPAATSLLRGPNFEPLSDWDR